MVIELLNKNIFDKTTLGEELLSHGGDRDMSDRSSAFLMLSTIGGREKKFPGLNDVPYIDLCPFFR